MDKASGNLTLFLANSERYTRVAFGIIGNVSCSEGDGVCMLLCGNWLIIYNTNVSQR